MSNMIPSTRFPFLVVLLISWCGTGFAYFIDNSCTQIQQTQIRAAIQEAIDMARYGEWRVQQKAYPLGQVTEQLLGPNALEVFPEKMQKIPSTFGQDSGQWNLNRRGPADSTLIIKCGSQHLQPSPDGLSWTDPDFPRSGSIRTANPAAPNARPCTQVSGEMARTYLTGLSSTAGTLDGPRFVVMLCQGWNNAVLSKPATLGRSWSTVDWTDVVFGRFSHDAMSVTVLHEAMHSMWFYNIGERITGRLPTGRREAYDFEDIENLPWDAKEKNAHSYALLAVVAWLKSHDVSRYGSMGPQKRAVRRLGPALTMPNDPHP